MKKIFIIYNIFFLSIGNILYSNIHYLHHDHEETHETHEAHECLDCINIDSHTNCIISCQESIFLDKTSNQFLVQAFQYISNNNDRIYYIRPPPIS